MARLLQLSGFLSADSKDDEVSSGSVPQKCGFLTGMWRSG